MCFSKTPLITLHNTYKLFRSCHFFFGREHVYLRWWITVVLSHTSTCHHTLKIQINGIFIFLRHLKQSTVDRVKQEIMRKNMRI